MTARMQKDLDILTAAVVMRSPRGELVQLNTEEVHP